MKTLRLLLKRLFTPKRARYARPLRGTLVQVYNFRTERWEDVPMCSDARCRDVGTHWHNRAPWA